MARASDARFDLIASCDVLIYFGCLHKVLNWRGGASPQGGLLAFTVERSEVAPFRLTDSERFAHHRDHVAEARERRG